MKPPCKDCADRTQGCHCVCEKYKAYRAECDAAMEKRNAEKAQESIYIEHVRNARKRFRRH